MQTTIHALQEQASHTHFLIQKNHNCLHFLAHFNDKVVYTKIQK
jgi:hypothetical protein